MGLIDGEKEIQRKLAGLQDKTGRKIIQAAARKAAVPARNALRSAVQSAPVSAELKRAARKTIGVRTVRESKEKTVKLGFGVAKQTEKRLAKIKARASDKTRKGVGVSSQNIHWFVLGTAERQTRKPRRRTGRLQSTLAGLAAQAVGASRTAMLEAARTEVDRQLAKLP